jgi:hypothetical protein
MPGSGTAEDLKKAMGRQETVHSDHLQGKGAQNAYRCMKQGANVSHQETQEHKDTLQNQISKSCPCPHRPEGWHKQAFPESHVQDEVEVDIISS